MTDLANATELSGSPSVPLSRRPSVGLCTYSTAPRGSVVHTASLADALTDAGWKVTVYALDKDGGGFYRPLRARGAPGPGGAGPSLDGGARPPARRGAGRLPASAGRPRPLSRPGLPHRQRACWPARAKRVASTGAGSHRPPRRGFRRRRAGACQARSIREADAVLTVSEAAQADVAAEFGIDSVIVGNGVDIARWAVPARPGGGLARTARPRRGRWSSPPVGWRPARTRCDWCARSLGFASVC